MFQFVFVFLRRLLKLNLLSTFFLVMLTQNICVLFISLKKQNVGDAKSLT